MRDPHAIGSPVRGAIIGDASPYTASLTGVPMARGFGTRTAQISGSPTERRQEVEDTTGERHRARQIWRLKTNGSVNQAHKMLAVFIHVAKACAILGQRLERV